MSKTKDISGQAFGRLTALERRGKDATRKTIWNCVCACGKQTQATMLNLVTGNTKSCGCLRRRPALTRGAQAGVALAQVFQELAPDAEIRRFGEWLSQTSHNMDGLLNAKKRLNEVMALETSNA